MLAVQHDPEIFSDEEQAMVELGVGKNMVRAIRFWMQAAGVVVPREDVGYQVSPFGQAITRFDPFLENIQTLWLIHWRLCHQFDEPLFAWDYTLNRWQQPEIRRSELLLTFRKEADRLERKLSDVTLAQHLDVFLHTYVPTRGAKGEIREDNLDSPLVELALIQKIGESAVDSTGRREAVYAFRREAKPEISGELFAYCLNDYWTVNFNDEMSLSFREIATAHGSPGQIFKLPEWDLRERLTTIARDSGGLFIYQESAILEQVQRPHPSQHDLLAAVYRNLEYVNV